MMKLKKIMKIHHNSLEELRFEQRKKTLKLSIMDNEVLGG
ncbi:hypothetical protein EMIT079MI2_130095 [Bacillus sp. IT-79MI2]